jgi:uncharacterized membrane protein
MKVYYLKPYKTQGHADIYCVVLEGNNKGYVTQFHLSENFAATFRHGEKYLIKHYSGNYNEYKIMDAQKAKEQIINTNLERFLPNIQTSIQFNLSLF